MSARIKSRDVQTGRPTRRREDKAVKGGRVGVVGILVGGCGKSRGWWQVGKLPRPVFERLSCGVAAGRLVYFDATRGATGCSAISGESGYDNRF
jgi:hypothetical protein